MLGAGGAVGQGEEGQPHGQPALPKGGSEDGAAQGAQMLSEGSGLSVLQILPRPLWELVQGGCQVSTVAIRLSKMTYCILFHFLPSNCTRQALERDVAEYEAHMIAAGLEAASARGRADHLEIEVGRLRAVGEVLEMQNRNLLAWRENQHVLQQGWDDDVSRAGGTAAEDGGSGHSEHVAGRGGGLQDAVHPTQSIGTSVASRHSKALLPLEWSHRESRDGDENRPPVAAAGSNGSKGQAAIWLAPPLPYPSRRDEKANESQFSLAGGPHHPPETSTTTLRHSISGGGRGVRGGEGRRRTMPMTPDLVSLDQIIADLSTTRG